MSSDSFERPQRKKTKARSKNSHGKQLHKIYGETLVFSVRVFGLAGKRSMMEILNVHRRKHFDDSPARGGGWLSIDIAEVKAKNYYNAGAMDYAT